MTYLQKYVLQDIYVKEFDMITSKDEAKAFAEHISCDCKCKFNSTLKNSKYLKSVTDTCYKVLQKSVKCGEIFIVMDIISTEKTNTKATNVTSTASINCRSKKREEIATVLHTVL